MVLSYGNFSVGGSMQSLAVQLSPGDVGVEARFWRKTALELARDIVCGLDSPANLAKQAGLTDMQWLVMQQWPAWKRLMAEVSEELAGTAGTLERARRRAALSVAEFVVQDMTEISGDPKVSPQHRIAAANVLVEVGHAGAKQQAGAASSVGAVGAYGALIQIVMPNGAEINVAPAPVIPQLVDLSAIEAEYSYVEDPDDA